jgi:hypothetical protein
LPANVFHLFTDPLEREGFRYAVTGSVAGSAYGEPRMTNDIDIVIDVGEDGVGRMAACFPIADFYFPPEEVVAVEVRRAQRGHFNVIHHDSGFKADFYPKGLDALQEWALAAARRVDVDGGPIALAPPEYVIVKKLEFFREGGSQKHVDDVAAIVRHQIAVLDVALIERHARRLGLDELWQKLATPTP